MTKLVALLTASLVLATACGEIVVDSASTTTVADVAQTTVPATDSVVPSTTAATSSGATTTELALATVQIEQLVRDDDGYQGGCYSGSGSMITADGFILTNFHVIENEGGECDYNEVGIAVTDQTDQEPQLRYFADVYAADPYLDLAILKIRERIDGESLGGDFASIPVGNSDDVKLGDEIRVLGYPAIGGSTITFTQGTVSGFGSEPGLDGRAWIKTDATFSGGNSGGAAVNSDGQLIGVPTEAGSGGDTDIADCRVIQDTNGDGSIDGADSCIPIGGFINGLRPVNLAAALIQEAQSGSRIEIPTYDDYYEPTDSDVNFMNLYFGTEIDTQVDAVANRVGRVSTGETTELCISWDFEGMSNGLTFDVLWYVDGELVEAASVFEQPWGLGATGNAWSCLVNYDGAVDDGLYEVTLNVDGELFGSANIFVGDAYPPHEFTLTNDSDIPICYIYLSPVNALYWGTDQLGSAEIIEAGSTRTWELASAVYDFRARNCDGDIVDESELDVTSDAAYSFRG